MSLPRFGGAFSCGLPQGPLQNYHTRLFSAFPCCRERAVRLASDHHVHPVMRAPVAAAPGLWPGLFIWLLQWAALMRQYRIYTVGTHGQFSGVQVIKCAHDQEAFQKAQQLAAGQDVELWEGARCIGRLSYEDQQTAD